jgi:hypothetical protein
MWAGKKSKMVFPSQSRKDLSWFSGPKIEFLRCEMGNYGAPVAIHGVKGSNGDEDVVSSVQTMDCESQHKFYRRAALMAEGEAI